MRRLLTLIAFYDFPNVQSSDYAQLLCAMGKSHEFCNWENEKWETSDDRKNFCEPFFPVKFHVCLPMTRKGTVAALECPEFLYRNKFTNITSPTLQYIQVECGTDLKWRINGKRILQKTGFGDEKWMLNSFGEDFFLEEIKKCEEALMDEAPQSRVSRSSSKNSSDYTLPEASCLDQEMFYHEPCREDPVSGAVRCDCSNLNLCPEDYIILIGNSISMVPLFFSIVILFSFPRLRNTRNLIHANMMTSLFLRCALQWLNYHAVIFEAYPDPECMLNVFHLNKEEYSRMTLQMCPDSQFIAFCRISFVLLQWAKTASHFWVLIEGVQLYALAVVTVLSTAKYFYAYLAFGWGFSWISVIFFSIFKYKYENKGCWDIFYRDLTEKIVEVPISAAITLNGIIFIILIWVIVLKLRDDSRLTRERNNAQRLTRATLTLIPLMGTQYLLFRYTPPEKVANVKYKYDLFFEGLQGLFVSILFCFMNQEVQRELKKWYNRQMQPLDGHLLRRGTFGSGIEETLNTRMMEDYTPRSSIAFARNSTERVDRRQSVGDERETMTTQVRRESNSNATVTSKPPNPVPNITPPSTL